MQGLRLSKLLDCWQRHGAHQAALTTWFLAFTLPEPEQERDLGACAKAPPGVSYPTAWLLRHKLMQVMFEREQASVLSGRIEIDDAFLGGEQAGRQGRGGNKVPFVAAVETDLRGRPQIVRFDRVDNHGLHAIQRWRLRPSPRRAWCSQTAGRAFNSWATWCNVMSGHITGHGPEGG